MNSEFPYTQTPPEGYQWVWDPSNMQYVLSPYGMDPYQQAQMELARQQFEWEMQQAQMNQGMDPFQAQQLAMQQAQLDAQINYWNQQNQFNQDQLRQQAQLQREQETARLAANPISWLQYADYTKQAPQVQPWMMGIGGQNYGLEVGGEIPGYQQGDMTGMPELLRPSQQYLARMGPTAQQQYLGYQSGQTGAPPQESYWRSQQTAPPGGMYSGLSRRK